WDRCVRRGHHGISGYCDARSRRWTSRRHIRYAGQGGQAGREEVSMGKRTHGRRGGTREAIRRLDAASVELSAARAQLAAASIVGQPPALPHPAYAILAANRARLLASPGVVGVGLGVRAAKPVICVFSGSNDGGQEM